MALIIHTKTKMAWRLY